MKIASEKPYMIWVTDRNGTTVGFGDLVMPARDWLKLGSYVMQEMIAETCLGKFFDEGMKTAVTTESDYKKYGYQSWVYTSSIGPMLAFHGHFGNIMVLDKERNTVMLLLSLNGNYGNYQILGDAGKIMDRLATLTE